LGYCGPDLKDILRQLLGLQQEANLADSKMVGAGQVPGSTWYSYSAVLLAYLDEDGGTIRPIPGQEASLPATAGTSALTSRRTRPGCCSTRR
jgi:hypothetical protein